MQAAGLVQVEAARSDGRWATAYAGSATMVMPEDFLEALQQDPAAHAFYVTLKRQGQFTIYHWLHSQAAGDPAEADGVVVGKVGAGRKPLKFPARARGV
ncbi:YdeI/OmpD-associated family protein [Acidovorax carolinensis]|uniref:YdeI/OmpD-associated family protein n=1 Tax=Acidovorax carolinensis TaxID=553814 RepID=UPI001F46AF25|nr:YdeI/OmpD-associated family protein [Acidovorax carolinensis]